MAPSDYSLHTLGWKSFQDLCVAVAEECLKRPVQAFLPSNDAGRDGAFVGRWNDASADAGSSTIQCKFTSLPHDPLSLTHLSDEFDKVRRLAEQGLARDYVILTNHPVSGEGELKIKAAFEAAGAGLCRVFGKDWLVVQIQKSARLRMMVPRIYGLGDLANILDGRAYEQAKMILSVMGEDLKRLVVTDAHRRSVRAISEHNFVLLLEAPAAGKSTIAASLAVGAADMWKSLTIRCTSPVDLRDRISTSERQFFWVDDAWGTTQYQKHTIEAWNQVLPYIQAAIQHGSQFLLTSRDYIWKLARHDLKTQALPLLERSRVVINVQELLARERAQILYNHVKLGDQPQPFRTAIKDVLPVVAASSDFLPETARRLGSTFFTRWLIPKEENILDFFQRPQEFLLETIRNLAADCKAAIALVFLSGGRIPSPVPDGDELQLAQKAFGVAAAPIKSALNALNGSLLLLANDETGPYWTYKHPTVGDAFAQLVAGDPELTEVYLRGAKPGLILQEVVCSGVTLSGAAVRVPTHLFSLLADRIKGLQSYQLAGFLSYRADHEMAKLILEGRPDLLNRLQSFSSPLSEDSDASLLARLHELGLLPEDIRSNFVAYVENAAVDDADASFLSDSTLRGVLTDAEFDSIMLKVEEGVLKRVSSHIGRLRRQWDRNYSPDDYFDQFAGSVRAFADEINWRSDYKAAIRSMEYEIEEAVTEMQDEYEPPATTVAPTSSKKQSDNPLADVFRDIDD